MSGYSERPILCLSQIEQGSMIFGSRNKAPGDTRWLGRSIMTDICDIFEVKDRPRWLSFRQQLKVKEQLDPIVPPLSVTIESVWARIDFGNVEHAVPAAAWATMVFLQDCYGFNLRSRFTVRDARLEYPLDVRQPVPDGRAKGKSLHNGWGYFRDRQTWDSITSLPEALRVFESEQAAVYGDEADPLAVTAMLGSGVSVREFNELWYNHQSECQPGKKTPAEATRDFHNSGVFVHRPPN